MDLSFKQEPNILVVDDIPLNVELLRTYLHTIGCKVSEANDGEAALRQVEKEKPDLILLDIMMPKINGFEVCRQLKSKPETQFIPIIMLTALQNIEAKVRGIEAGADDFISKPFNKMELMARVKSLLRIKFLHDELETKVDQLNEARDRLQQLAVTDGLTGLYNYRHFKEQLVHEINRAERHNLFLSLIMIDIDFFKYYNDKHGHPAGDEVLREIAEIIQKNIRKIDIAIRYGGEEFAIILPETNQNAAKIVAEKIRKLVEENPIEYEEQQPNGRLTISLGVATFPDDTKNGEKLISIADNRLYKAKKKGRNRVIFK